MRIIIVGCGKVGSALAEQLSAEGHDLTLIDLSERRLEELTNRLDLTAVAGSGTSYQVLLEAGVQDTDLVIAVTTHDEINLLSCLIARKASDCHAIARVRDPQYVADLGFIRDELGISMAINPELSTARVVSRLIRFPSAIGVSTFARAASSCSTSAFRLSPVWRAWRYARSIPFCAPMCCCAWSAAATRPISPRATSFCTRATTSRSLSPEGAEVLLRPDRRAEYADQDRHARRRRQDRLFPREDPARFRHFGQDHRKTSGAL